jgi:hypothetical protein
MPTSEARVSDLFEDDGFEFAVSMDCEGTNYDKNLDANVLNLERFVSKASEHGIRVVLFVTPIFADALRRHGLAERLPRDYRVIYGLHIHPDNLPGSIAKDCPFLRPGEEYLASYTREEQRSIIAPAADYLEECGVFPLQAFRGGCFSMNDDTAAVVLEETSIRAESHNPFREQYSVTSGGLRSLPVYALSRDEEFRLEFFTTEKLRSMLSDAIAKDSKVMAITHSYMLDPDDFHYGRDGIVDDIHTRLARLIDTMEAAR